MESCYSISRRTGSLSLIFHDYWRACRIWGAWNQCLNSAFCEEVIRCDCIPWAINPCRNFTAHPIPRITNPTLPAKTHWKSCDLHPINWFVHEYTTHKTICSKSMNFLFERKKKFGNLKIKGKRKTLLLKNIIATMVQLVNKHKHLFKSVTRVILLFRIHSKEERETQSSAFRHLFSFSDRLPYTH